MKYNKYIFILTLFTILFISSHIFAQPGGPPGGGGAGAAVGAAAVPLDGGALALLLSGVALWGRKYLKNKKEK